jgi:suppressor of fused-like protein
MGILNWLFGGRSAAEPAPSPKPPRGRDAIDTALEGLYPDTLELRLAGPSRGVGQAPSIAELAIYPSPQGRAHWHYVAYGLSAIGPEQPGGPALSGFGFELTFRLARGTETSAPRWPVDMLSALADHVQASGGRFSPGHVKRLDASALPAPDSPLDHVLFVSDPELGPIDTVNGRMDFVQAVLITSAEAERAARRSGEQLAAELVKTMPLFVSDVSRAG